MKPKLPKTLAEAMKASKGQMYLRILNSEKVLIFRPEIKDWMVFNQITHEKLYSGKSESRAIKALLGESK